MNGSERVDGAALLDELHAALIRYVILPSRETTDAVVLWIAATHALAAFEHATRLAIHSPVKRCGKSRLLEVIEATAHNTVATTNISVPALFRMIEAADTNPPTLLLDEADRLFGSTKKDEDNRDLIAILNNGYRQGKPTIRCVGPSQVPTPFRNYAMAAIAGIGRKPDTIEDRAINVTMRRRMPGESVAKFRLRTDVPALHDLRDRLQRWAASRATQLEAPVSDIPAGMEDRAEDSWEPLLAVADVAGGSWPRRARAAARRITAEASTDDGEQSLDTTLLADVRRAFGGATFIPTSDLLTKLRGFDESPWGDFDLNARKLAIRLGKFGVKPKSNGSVRGYELEDFYDAFGRYLPPDPSDPSGPVNVASDLHESIDGSGTIDGSTRQDDSTRQDETAGQTPNGRVLTGSEGVTAVTEVTDNGKAGPECSVCGSPLLLVLPGRDTCERCRRVVEASA